ncbi:MAG: stage III sporulation protein AF [Lachnospiraceae bacterium]|nr:stage III sporulation protein AF [Lachnospiraceae bacterium]
MGMLLEYIKNIGYFLILMSLVSNVMPDNSYKKYCRMFCGLILVVLVINPFYEFLNFEGDIKDIFAMTNYKSQAMELENQIKMSESGTREMAIKEYERLIVNELQGRAIEEGLYIMEAHVELTEGEDIQLSRLKLTVTEKEVLQGEELDGDFGEYIAEDEESEEGTKIRIEDISIGDIKEDNVQSYITNPRALSFMRKAAEYLQIDEGIIDIELYEEAIDGE